MSKSIIDKIKTFEDARAVLNINNNIPDVSMILEENRKFIIAAHKLLIIIKALNGGWEPNLNDNNENKYLPYFHYKSEGGCASSFGFSGTAYVNWITFTTVGSRLCFKTEELAEYAGKQFLSIYRDYLTLEDKELRKINAFLS